MEVLEGALRLYKPEEIAMSFNGGKDATVLLHLLRAAVAGNAGGGISKVNVVKHNSECNNASP
jgi:3'-phosphoadenosine 5'-phosphosulfate sulfotransferase (PAPS reductase)/FAD synthetase